MHVRRNARSYRAAYTALVTFSGFKSIASLTPSMRNPRVWQVSEGRDTERTGQRNHTGRREPTGEREGRVSGSARLGSAQRGSALRLVVTGGLSITASESQRSATCWARTWHHGTRRSAAGVLLAPLRPRKGAAEAAMANKNFFGLLRGAGGRCSNFFQRGGCSPLVAAPPTRLVSSAFVDADDADPGARGTRQP